MTQAGKQEERQKLVNLISQWNQDHYDIFELSQPNEVIFTNTGCFLVCKMCVLFNNNYFQTEKSTF